MDEHDEPDGRGRTDGHDRTDGHHPSEAETVGPPRRTAPPSYVASSAHRTPDSAGVPETPLAPARESSATGAQRPARTVANPVYGRVTRFGIDDGSTPATPTSPGPYAGWRPPAVSQAEASAAGPGVPWGPPTGAPAGVPYGPVSVAAPPAPSWSDLPPAWTGSPPALEPPDGYAGWGRRVVGYLIDEAPALVASALVVAAYVPLYVGLFRRDPGAHPTWSLLVVGAVLSVAALGWSVYNRWVLAGRTGQSVGKRVMRTWLVGLADGRPVGVLNAFLRDLLHVLDRVAYVGFLWPLWDERRQTLSDKLMQTVVVRTPVPPLTDAEHGRPV